MKEKNKILDKEGMDRALERISHEIVEEFGSIEGIAIIGIKKGGAFIAERIASKIKNISGLMPSLGALDITLYRDDLTQVSQQPVVRATEIDFALDGKNVILVDDVLFSGRTIRSAMDALVDFGRPALIRLAVLIDRGHRELPIRADYVGKNVPTSQKESVEVRLAEVDGKDEVVVCE